MALFQKAQQVAQQLTDTLTRNFPSTLEPMTGRKTLDIRNKAIQQLLEQAIALQRTEKLGILSRIVFARSFQNHLKAAGYSSAFIRQTTAEVIAKITFAA